jgi:hypothetical protein
VLRVADIATTDGTTRTSINAAFQVVPVEERLAVQAVVEGIGVPVAIGATGVFLLLLEALDLGVGAVIVFGLTLSVIWTVVAVSVYRSYTRALADEVRRRPVLADEPGVLADDVPAVRALLGSDDARDVRLGLDLLAGAASPASDVELRRLAAHGDPEVRLRALGQLAAAGDGRAVTEAASLVQDLVRSPDARDRRAAAVGLQLPEVAADRGQLVQLLDDPDPSVRSASLDAVMPADAEDERVVSRVVDAAGEARVAGSATAALLRLGDAAVPLLRAALAREGVPRRPSLVRAAAVAATDHGIEVVAPALEDPDRTVVLATLEALDAAGGQGLVDPHVLGAVQEDASSLAARAVAARTALVDDESPLARALDDEIDLARRLVLAVLALRHGDRVRQAVRVVDHGEGARRALGVEALDVLLSREEAAIALPLVRRDLASMQQAAERQPKEWIDDIAGDPQGVWRSPWLAACALHAAAR